MSGQGMAGDLHSVVERRLRGVDQRYTTGRRAIIDLLVGAGHPVSIGDIAERLPGLPRSSAYRHLVDLETAGLVRRVAANDEFTRFELAEDLVGHHHHLICSSCGTVEDVPPNARLEQSLRHAIDQVTRSTGFRTHAHRVDLVGLCRRCA